MRAPTLKILSTLVVALAVGVVVSGCGPTNREACFDYVDKVNAAYLACGVATLVDEEETCPAYLDRGGADCREYYECLGEEIECRGGVIVHQGDPNDPTVADNRRCAGCI